jgi:site-specific recombinase XerD
MFLNDIHKISANKITFELLNKDLILSFLDWLQTERNSTIATRNQRLAAIHSFFRYVQSQDPSQLHLSQQILLIPFKKSQQPLIQHLTPEQTKILLATPDSTTLTGRRDMTLLCVLYDTGARVQELCDLRIKDLRLEFPSIITLTGKGRKTRQVPIMGNTEALLKQYFNDYLLNHKSNPDFPLFFNQKLNKLTRGGICHILHKYTRVLEIDGISNIKVTPHILRHSKAMHLSQSGVNLFYIRDILGHVDISTTDIYARLDMESKRIALEKVYPELSPEQLPDWKSDKDLLDFLNSL